MTHLVGRWATAAGAAVVALSLVLPLSSAAGRGKPPRNTKPPVAVSVDVLAVHNAQCANVSEYVDCSAIQVTVADFGAVGWTGSSGPAAGTVKYNTHFTLTEAQWAQVVAHEMGGHHDAWAEIVAKVGVSQAWTDYYDLDYFAEPWIEAQYLKVAGTPRDFTSTESKEMWLDCAGPVAHGYPGIYLSNRSVPNVATFCQGSDTVMNQALTQAR